MSPLPERFGRYRVLKPLGSGGMGAVYLAEDTQLQRRVALKVPSFERGESPELLERFYREARAAALLRHPNICPVYDVGAIQGRHYISMAFVEGKSLAAYVRADKPPSERQVLALLRKLALALQEAHDQGIVHRDLKPANIMIDGRGEPVIMDFGLAHRVGLADELRLTQTGVIMGSPAYMSPEQVEGLPDTITPATDQYSLGVILYELLTSQLPFRGTLTAVIAAILTQTPQAPSELRAGLDPRIEALCQRMMARSPADRFPSLRSVADEAAALLKSRPAAASSSAHAKPSPAGADAAAAAVDPLAAPAAPLPTGSHKLFPGGRTPSRFRPWHRAAIAAGLPLLAICLLGLVSKLRNGQAVVDHRRPAAPAPAMVDLLAAIDPGRDTVYGLWRLEESVLQVPAVRFARLQIPVDPPEAYELTAVVERTSDDNAFTLGLVVGRSQTEAVFDAGNPKFRGKGHGLHLLDGRVFMANDTFRQQHSGLLLPTGKPRTLVATVRTDRIVVTCDGQTVIDWIGDSRRLSLQAASAVPHPRRLFVGSGGSAFRISKLQLRPLDGESAGGSADPDAAAAGDSPLTSDEYVWSASVDLTPVVNGQAADMDPALFGDLLTLMFCRPGNAENGKADLWMCSRASSADRWPAPTSLGPHINTDANDCTPALSADGLTLIFASGRVGGIGHGDLWMATRKSAGEPWSEPTCLDRRVNSDVHDFCPALSSDGRTLVFASNRPGGQGKLDLWMCQRPDAGATWSQAVNLGPDVNSENQDLMPVLSHDGQYLLLASDRPGGLGAADVWLCRRSSAGGPWLPPTNLGPSVNTEAPDMSWALSPSSSVLVLSTRPPKLKLRLLRRVRKGEG